MGAMMRGSAPAVIAVALLLGCTGQAARAETMADLAARIAAATQDSTPAAAPLPASVMAPAVAVTLPVPAVNLYPNDKITGDVLVERTFTDDLAGQGMVASTREQLIGKVARRVLPAGSPISLSAFGDPKLVMRGTAARVHFESGGLSMSTMAMPMDSGAAGEIIRLKNIDSGQMITGVVEADGSVKVGS
jgi:flagellar basal body P-ring formation protein FlgA